MVPLHLWMTTSQYAFALPAISQYSVLNPTCAYHTGAYNFEDMDEGIRLLYVSCRVHYQICWCFNVQLACFATLTSKVLQNITINHARNLLLTILSPLSPCLEKKHWCVSTWNYTGFGQDITAVIKFTPVHWCSMQMPVAMGRQDHMRHTGQSATRTIINFVQNFCHSHAGQI